MKKILVVSILFIGLMTVAILQNDAANQCIAAGQNIEISYDDITGMHTQLVAVGADFGTLSENNGNYACMGQCGGGCSEGPWLAACLSHDICSFNNKSTGFVFDKSCGDEAAQATLSVMYNKLFSCPE
jgi:hypothetical protein